jgi:D-alanyl-D-alanine carboxypeptidase
MNLLQTNTLETVARDRDGSLILGDPLNVRKLRPIERLSSHNTVLAAMICAALCAGARGDDAPAAVDQAGLTSLRERVQSRLDQLVDKFDVPGVTAAIVLADGQTVVFAAGMADCDGKLPMTPNHRMPAGSVGKTFVAATALSLARDGKLSLDDKVEKWLGGESWFADLPNGRELTVRHLLMHRGGLTDHVNDPRFAAQVRESIARPGSDPDFYFKPAELVGFVLLKKPLFTVGSGYRYTDTGYILLGMIIERAGGTTYDEQVESRFLEPLGLTHTVAANRRDLPELACGHVAPNNPLGLPEQTLLDGKLRFHPANEWTGGGLVSNPQDLARWAKLLYEGKAMRQPYLDELLLAAAEDREKSSRYGLGVFVTESSKLGTSYGHGGFYPGYLTRMAYYPKQRVAIAVQFSTDHPKVGAAAELEGLMADALRQASAAE